MITIYYNNLICYPMNLQIVNIEICPLYMSRKAKKWSLRRLKLKSSRGSADSDSMHNLISKLRKYTIFFFGGNHWMLDKLLT